MTFYELMLKSLSDMLEDGESLLCSIYGTLYQKSRHDFGYFGLTEPSLLIVLLLGDSRKIGYSGRVPLSRIRKVRVKNSLIPLQRRIFIDLDHGETVKIRVSGKVYGFKTQAENLDAFLKRIKR